MANVPCNIVIEITTSSSLTNRRRLSTSNRVGRFLSPIRKRGVHALAHRNAGRATRGKHHPSRDDLTNRDESSGKRFSVQDARSRKIRPTSGGSFDDTYEGTFQSDEGLPMGSVNGIELNELFMTMLLCRPLAQISDRDMLSSTS